MPKLILKDKKILFSIFQKEVLNIFSIEDICLKWNIHKGTIKRWIEKEEVPLNYFNFINKILNNKYKLNISEEEQYKNLDQFFTPKNLSILLIEESIRFIEKNYDINLSDYDLIEPSAGAGSFLFNFPKNKFKNVIGLDIEPQNKKILKKDWLEFEPKNKNNIIIGNPPFGLRGQLALQFINHAAKFSDFICFILPPLFNSNGKGSPMLRVDKNLFLAKQIYIKDNDYLYPNGKKVKINSIFQIWTKINSKNIKPIMPPVKHSDWVKIYSLSNGKTPSSKRNIKMLDKCDFYLPSTSFHKIKLEKKFEKLPNNRGYGIVILKEKNKIKSIIEKINWDNVSFKSTNSANNLRTQLIIEAIERYINE